jgi:hypothetical protein
MPEAAGGMIGLVVERKLAELPNPTTGQAG